MAWIKVMVEMVGGLGGWCGGQWWGRDLGGVWRREILRHGLK